MMKRLSESSAYRSGRHPAAWSLRMLLAAAIVAGLAFMAGPARTGQAATAINVTTTADNTANDGFCSLREALSYTNGSPANGNCGADTGSPYTINLPAGTYNISLGELQVGMPGNVTVTLAGAGAASTIIHQTQDTERVFDLDPVVNGNVDVTMSGVTISGGYAQVYGGGAILGGGTGDSLELSDSIITDNHTSGANSAAGISWSPAGDVTITNTVFSNNVSGQAAGAILFTTDDGSTLTITGSTFLGNTAGASSASAGGALLLGMPGAGTAPTFNITHNTFVNNQAIHAAGAGGAIFIGSGNLNLQYNHIVGNTAGVAGSGGLAVYGGTVNATENWWGCNTGPGGACNGALLSGGTLVTAPYLYLGNTADPATIGAGQSSTLTAGFLRDSADNPVAPSDLAAMTGVAVSWSATNGTLSGQQTAIQSGGTATAVLTNNACADSTGSATVDSATATVTVTVQCSNLTAVKSNDAGGTTELPAGWTWTIHIANGGAVFAAFADGNTLLTDTLPNSGLTYGAPAISGASGLTGAVNCTIDGSSNLTCSANGPVQLAAGGSFDVVFTATPSAAGSYANPRPAGSCAVDPGGVVLESNEGDNACSDTVVVTENPPGAFSKTGPVGGAYVTTGPALAWGASSGVSEYEYCIDTNDNDACDESWISTGSFQSVALSGLTAGTAYYWQVRAVNTAGSTEADGGAWWSFTALNQTFADVPVSYWAWAYIERLFNAGITGGCGTSPLIFCPASPVMRGQIAIFLERGMHGSAYTPPPATGTVFGDVPISYWSAAWIEQLYAEGITAGCGGGNYCPNAAVTRAEMAILLLRAEHGSAYTPPPATGIFTDVPVSHWAAAWIEQLYAEGITGGCGGGKYCPNQAVTRAEMAILIVRTFSLP